nr:hypothetical protein HK105_002708 [Polyrhizophydium stewartii]
MITAKPGARNSAIVWLSATAWVLAVAVLSIDVTILDYFISPYAHSGPYWHPKMVCAGFVLNPIALAVMLLLFMVRIRVFYQNSSPVFWLLLLLAIATFALSVLGSAWGIISDLDVFDGKIMIFTDSPHINMANAFFAACHAAEGLFSSLSSMAFLWSIGKSLGFSKQGFFYEVMFKHDGIRFIVIIILNLIVAGFAVDAYFTQFTYVTFTSWYMPPLIDAIEIRTFLITSYVSTRNIIQTKTVAQTGRRSDTSDLRSAPSARSEEEQRRAYYEMQLEEQRKATVRHF